MKKMWAQAAVAMLFAIAIHAEQVRVSPPTVVYASPQLFGGDALDGATVFVTPAGSAAVWYETLPFSADRALFLAPLRADGAVDVESIREVSPYPGAAAFAASGREILIASSSDMLVYDVTGYLRNFFSLRPMTITPEAPRAITAAIHDGTYVSALLDDTLTLDVRQVGNRVATSSDRWNLGGVEVTLHSGRAGTIIGATSNGCPLIFAPCNLGIDVTVRGESGLARAFLYRTAEASGAPAIASDDRSFLLAWPSNAPNCPANEMSGMCNALRFGRVTAEARPLDPDAGVFLANVTHARTDPAATPVAAVWTGRNYVVVWQTSFDGSDSDLRGAVISSSGVVTARFDVATTSRNEIIPALSVAPGGDAIVTYLSGPDWRIETRSIATTDGRSRAVRR